MPAEEDFTPTEPDVALLVQPGVLKSRAQACVRCQQRKVKCDKKDPCSNCVKGGAECTSAALLPPRRRKRRFAEAELLARLRRYEEVLTSYGVDIDAIGGGEKGDGLKAGQEAVHGAEAQGGSIGKWGSNSTDNGYWTSLKDEFRDTEEVLEGSDEDGLVEAPITTTWESMGSNGEATLLFGSQHTKLNLMAYHPQPIHIIRLWQIFLDNVNPLIKIIHAPTVQQQILEISTDLGSVSKGMEALLFSIYSLAILSVDDAYCKDMFGEETSTLLAKYQYGAQQALLNAEFLRPSSLVVLQALVLYLISVRQGVDPRCLSCLTSVAIRIGQQMGLHREDSSQGLSPFELEMRRRLWWQIILFESRVAEFSGIGTAVLTHQWNTKLPLNVNDGDLDPNMKEPPIEHKGLTEMVFCLTRCEIAEFLRRLRSTSVFDGCWNELSSSLISLTAKNKAIEELEKLLERKYLKYCDPSIPLHLLSMVMTKLTVCKMKHVVHHPRLLPDRGANLPQFEKDRLFNRSLKMIEYSNILHSNKSIEKFIWFIIMNKPMDAVIFALCELRYRTTGEAVDRAWQLVEDCSKSWTSHRSFPGKPGHCAMHLSVMNLVAKSWEARASALSQTQPFTSPPDFIQHIQATLDSRKAKKADASDIYDAPALTDAGIGANQYVDVYQPNPVATNGIVDSSILTNWTPMEDPLDWMQWSNLMHAYPYPTVDPNGETGISYE